MDLSAWLRDLGFERYAAAFAAHDVDAEILPKVTAEDLIAIGVTSVGHRRKLLEAIVALQASDRAEAAALPPRPATPSDAGSRCCSATWSARRSFRRASIRKTRAR